MSMARSPNQHRRPLQNQSLMSLLFTSMLRSWFSLSIQIWFQCLVYFLGMPRPMPNKGSQYIMFLWKAIWCTLNMALCLLQHSYQRSMILLCQMDSVLYNIYSHTQQSSKFSYTHAHPCVPIFSINVTFSKKQISHSLLQYEFKRMAQILTFLLTLVFSQILVHYPLLYS